MTSLEIILMQTNAVDHWFLKLVEDTEPSSSMQAFTEPLVEN